MSNLRDELRRFHTPLLFALLLACVVRFWLFLLPESFWIDETLTAFVVRYGASHPSLAAAPGVGDTIYYWLPRLSQSLLGFSEFSLRLPSLLATLVSLCLIARLAARLIHPLAGWLAVFLCFIPHEFTRQATDARPYGLGTCIALCAIWFLVRWLDDGRLRDAILFILFAAMLLRVQLIYWPFYGVFVCYAIARGLRRNTLIVLAIMTATLIPTIPATLALFHHAGQHIVTEPPTWKTILSGFQFAMIGAAGIGAYLLARIFRWLRKRPSIATSGIILLLTWWLWQPMCLLAVSLLTGNSIFLPRYFSVAIPGMILAATLAASYSMPTGAWKTAATILALVILIVGVWKSPFPPTRNSHWREAAAAVNDLERTSPMPVICPSPFVEAQPPVWTPGYELPGFLYAHLAAYPIHATPILLPARLAPEGESYARAMVEGQRRFIVYGGIYTVNLWAIWLTRQPEFAAWSSHSVGSFGDVEVTVFEAR